MPSARLDFRNHRLARLLLAVVFVLSMIVTLRGAWDRFDELLHGDRYVEDDFSITIDSLKVTRVGTAEEQAGLRRGDILIGVNDRPVQGLADILGPEKRARTGDHLLLRVKRTEQTESGLARSIEKDISVPLHPFTYVSYAPGSAEYDATILFRVLTPLFCLALGFWVAAVRVGDPAAWTLLVLMLSVANLILDDRTTYGNEDVLQPLLTGLSIAFIRLGPLALAYFGIIFPERLSLDRKFPWIKWLVIGPMLVRAGLDGIEAGVRLHHLDIAVPLWATLAASGTVGGDIELGLIGLFFVILGYKTVTATTSDARRRFLLLDTGAAIGLLPFLVTLIWAVIHSEGLRGWSALLSIAALLVFPLTMAYVIVVHRAMDVRVVLRQGLRYLLATTMSANSSMAARVGLIAVGFALLAGLGAFADRLRCWIDRRFFREAYEADEILADLAARVGTMVETGRCLKWWRAALPVPCTCRASRFFWMGMERSARHTHSAMERLPAEP